MRFSRLGIFLLILSTVLIGANCSYYNRVIARKNLVDGGQAYKDRKFREAEQLFRSAIARGPQTMEGKTAQLFLARTLHSIYIGKRDETATAEEAIAEYKKVLADDINSQSSYKAIGNLLTNLNKEDEAFAWTTERANNEKIKPEYRADAYSTLAAKKYSCANEISDVEAVKKTVKKDGKDVFQFVKPANPQDFEKFKQCIQEGMELIDKAIALQPATVDQAKNADIKQLSIPAMNENQDLLRVFGAVWSYKASLLVQAMRLAEMEGRTPDKDSLKRQSDEARDKFLELNEAEKKLEAEKEERRKAADPATANK